MRVKTYLAAMLLSFVVTPKAKAQSSSLNKQALGVSVLDEPMSNSSKAQVYGQVRMEGMQYLTPIAEASQLTYSQLLSARLSAVKETSWIDFAGDVSGGTFFSKGQSHLVVHELYMASHGSSKFKTFLGRKKKDWSDVDQRWQLGLWQPTFAIDALRPEEQGLTGLFLDYTEPQLEILGFVTPMFIPNMGPDIREEGGGLVADSRWYRAPSRDYDFNNRINTIQYDLDIPETAKLVANPGAAFMVRVGEKEKGAWVNASAGYLPVNELVLKRQNFKDVSADKVDVTVSPTVTYHSVSSIDVGYSYRGIKGSLSYLQDEPKEILPETDWSIQKMKPAQVYSAAVDFSMADIFSKTLAFHVEYLKVFGGGIVDIISSGAPDDFTLFDKRFKFTNALSLGVEGQLASFFRRPFVTRFKYIYDYDQRGSLLNTEFLYYPSQKWAVVMGGDVLGVQDETYSPSSFLNQYRANDRVYGGMTYVF